MFYRFNQNNSGGRFHLDEKRGIGVDVYIEADSADEANDLAEGKGIYFNGCRRGQDCDCCGDRWYSVGRNDGEEYPHINGDYAFTCHDTAYVHLKDGRIVRLTAMNYDLAQIKLSLAEAGVDT